MYERISKVNKVKLEERKLKTRFFKLEQSVKIGLTSLTKSFWHLDKLERNVSKL